jgi:hypothetical protein
MAYQATDSFTTEIDGAPVFVAKGEILPNGHPVVKVLKDTGLFRSLIEDQPPAAKPARAAKAGSGGNG